jgi:hypothetical protein
MSWVWEQSRAEGTDRLILLAIADYAHDDGTEAFPSVATLAEKAKVSERTVQRSIRSLVLLGELQVEQNAGRRGANVYTIRMGRQSDTPVNLTPPTESHPRQRDGVTPVTPRGDTRVTRTISNHPTTPQPPASGGPRPKRHCNRHTKFRNGCDNCRAANTAAADAEREAELRRSEAVLAELREAKANAVPRPKDLTA